MSWEGITVLIAAAGLLLKVLRDELARARTEGREVARREAFEARLSSVEKKTDECASQHTHHTKNIAMLCERTNTIPKR